MDRIKRISKIDEEETETDEDFKKETNKEAFDQKLVPANTPSSRRKMDSIAENLSTPLLRSSTESLIECLKNVSKTLSDVKKLDEDDKVSNDMKCLNCRLYIG